MAGAGGRKKRPPSQAPMPRQWKDTERLAACLAYLEVSEKGPTASLEQDVDEAYPAQLQYVHDNVKAFVPSRHRWDKKWYIYTLQDAKTRRCGKNTFVDRFKATRKACVNTIMTAYLSLLNSDGTVPSGAAKDELIKDLRAKLKGRPEGGKVQEGSGADPVRMRAAVRNKSRHVVTTQREDNRWSTLDGANARGGGVQMLNDVVCCERKYVTYTGDDR